MGEIKPTLEECVNGIIQWDKIDANKISDGYHTFGELYEHRVTLFITLCRTIAGLAVAFEGGDMSRVWRSKKHHDDTEFEGWFIMGIGTEKGNQISYHLPLSKWDETKFCATLLKAPEWDGHTSNDVLERLKQL